MEDSTYNEAMKAAFEAKYQRDWNDPAGDDMKVIWTAAWNAAQPPNGLVQLAERVACLNVGAGEIDAGMLAQLVQQANTALSEHAATCREVMATAKLTPGEEKHLTLLMAPYKLNFFVGKDREDLLAYGRDVWAAAVGPQSVKSAECKT